jgi:hypothetical protein
MRLVPRQLQFHGLTGDVPYYGGRLTPAQAHAASRPRPPAAGAPQAAPPPGLAPVGGAGGAIPVVPVPPGAPAGPPVPGLTARPESKRAIQQLLLAGIITPAEASQLSGRLG